jgi:EAL domain-containing protein (putative c-di-GMP-specific phosphodiesterase class I)
MVKNKKVYFGLILLLALIVINSIVKLDYFMIVLSVLGIGLIGYQLRVNEDVRLVITKNKIKRKYKKRNLNNYYVILLEITNLSTYSQFYDIKLSDYIMNETYKILKKKVHNNVFLYSADQLVIINEFENKTVINQLLRNNEQNDITRRIIRYVSNHKFKPSNSDESYHAKITAGTGSVSIRENNKSIDSLIKLAHFTMLKAKNENKQLIVATEEIRIIKEDIEIFNLEIDQGIEYDEFNPHFLPIIDPTTMNVIGCESLCRWEKNEYRIIEVAKFKKIAEEKNLFEKIDKLIIKKSFIAYQTWQKKELIKKDFIITINLSLQSLLSMKAHEIVVLAQQYNIDRECVEFDISEQDIFRDNALYAIEKLKEVGFKVSIDAFYSNTTVLKSLINIGVDTLKLDKITLPASDIKAAEYRFYKTLIKFSKIMGYKVMSKGIENKVQLQVAKELKVDFVQGYYFTPPLNDTKILGFLNKYQDGILV